LRLLVWIHLSATFDLGSFSYLVFPYSTALQDSIQEIRVKNKIHRQSRGTAGA
jgi:hypothetical protein